MMWLRQPAYGRPLRRSLSQTPSWSLDNVLAVAGAAHGDFILVVMGLLISVPIVVWGAR